MRGPTLGGDVEGLGAMMKLNMHGDEGEETDGRRGAIEIFGRQDNGRSLAATCVWKEIRR